MDLPRIAFRIARLEGYKSLQPGLLNKIKYFFKHLKAKWFFRDTKYPIVLIEIPRTMSSVVYQYETKENFLKKFQNAFPHLESEREILDKTIKPNAINVLRDAGYESGFSYTDEWVAHDLVHAIIDNGLGGISSTRKDLVVSIIEAIKEDYEIKGDVAHLEKLPYDQVIDFMMTCLPRDLLKSLPKSRKAQGEPLPFDLEADIGVAVLFKNKELSGNLVMPNDFGILTGRVIISKVPNIEFSATLKPGASKLQEVVHKEFQGYVSRIGEILKSCIGDVFRML